MIGAELESRYRIEAELGSGGVGSVYRATHLKLGRAVAIKVLRPEYGSSAELVQRFQREAQALAALSHPNVVTVTDYGVVGETPYLVMELLEGETLSERLKRGALEPGDAIEVMRQLLAALAFVHDAGLVHRDVKPGNVFLQKVPGEKIHVRLLDFGLAKFLAPTAGGRPITRAGQIFGTPSYMSPEQVAGQDADARADVYAAGIIFFEMLSGRAPFRGKTSEVMRLHLMEELPKIQSVHPARVATPAWWALLTKATAKGRAERFPTVKDFAAALEALGTPVVVAPESVPTLETQATSFSPNSAPTRIDAPIAQSSSESREPAAPTMRDNVASAPEGKSPEPGAIVAESAPEMPMPTPVSVPPDAPDEPLAVVRFARAVIRFALSVLVLASLGALLVAAAVVYVLVTPEREKERRHLEEWLGRSAPADGAVPGTASASASSGVREAPPPATAEAPSAVALAEAPPASAAPSDDSDKRVDAVPATSAEPSAAPETPPVATETAPAAVPPPRPLGPAPDPWSTVPRDLVRLVGKVNQGKTLSKREISSVHQFNAKRPDDPRGHLVLARGYLNKRWIKDAANEYSIAMKVNEGARGDPRMLRDLVRIVEFGSAEGERLIREIYGSAALAPIDRALIEANPEAKERLERLRAELSPS